MTEGEDYKGVVKRYMGTVKEILGDGDTFNEMFASIMKVQEKVLASSMKEGEGGLLPLPEGGDYAAVLEEIKKDLSVIKKRLVRLERAVLKPKGSE